MMVLVFLIQSRTICKNFYEHIDGLTFVLPKPNKKSI